jgi:hypothetical protein
MPSATRIAGCGVGVFILDALSLGATGLLKRSIARSDGSGPWL